MALGKYGSSKRLTSKMRASAALISTLRDWSGDSLETPGDGSLDHLHTLFLGQLLDAEKG
jgi:hypothetical protein